MGDEPASRDELLEELRRLRERAAILESGAQDRTGQARLPEENPNPVLRFAEDGTLLYANPAAQSLLTEWGCALGDVAPGTWRAEIARALASARRSRLEVRRRRHVLSFDVVPVPDAGYVNAYGRDITPRKRSLDALRRARAELEARVRHRTAELIETNELLERIFDNIHVLVAYLDRDFNFIRVNWAYAAAGGREPDYFVGRNHFDLYPNAENQAIFRHVVDTGEHYVAHAKPFEHPDQPERGVTYWDWSLVPVRDARGEVGGVLLSLLDVTERKRLENEIAALSDREQRRIGRDLHDTLGQQLTGMLFVLDQLEADLHDRGLPEAEEVTKAVEMLEQSIEQTRALARGLSPVMDEPGGLTSALAELAESVEAQFGITCRFEAPEDLLVTDNDAAVNLYRIAQEAVSNAIRHGKANEIRIRLARNEGRGCLAVHDDGVGIAPDATDGGGMGLHIMPHRAKSLGGRLDVQPDAERGTVVTCTFPTRLLTSPEEAPDAR
ncbi:MAG: PAS domain-containing protein [Planctomycetota bacterium]